MEHGIRQSIDGGIVGTAAITATMFLLSLAGIPQIYYGKLLGQITNTGPEVGWVLHFAIGIAVAFLYVYFFREFLPGKYWVKGIVFGVLPWVLTLLLLFPMIETIGINDGIQSPGMFMVSSMVAYLAFGIVLAVVAHPRGVGGEESFHVPASGH